MQLLPAVALGTNTFGGLRKEGLSKGKIGLLSVAKRPLLVGPSVALEVGYPSQLTHLETRRLDLNNGLPPDQLMDAAASWKGLGPWMRQLSD